MLLIIKFLWEEFFGDVSYRCISKISRCIQRPSHPQRLPFFFFCSLEPNSARRESFYKISGERQQKGLQTVFPRSFKSAQAVRDVASLQGALAGPALAKFHVPIYRSLQQGRQCQDGTWNAERIGFPTGFFWARDLSQTWCGLRSHPCWLSSETSPALTPDWADRSR